MKRWFHLTIVLVLVVSVVLVGCSSNNNNESTSGNNKSGTSSGTNTGTGGGEQVTITVATVNNPDNMIMVEMAKDFEAETGIKVDFAILPENELRDKVTQDVALGAGKFDITTIGLYEVPIWAENEWIVPISPYIDKMSDNEKKEFDLEDIFPVVRDALTYKGQLYALPLVAQSSMLYYNKEMLEKANVKMPLFPTWQEVAAIAKKAQEANGVPGIVLRGLPGWGEVLAPLNTVINAFGGRWYDENWNAQLTSPEVKEAVQFYVDLLNEAGQPGAFSTGFTEGLTLMQQGKAAMWYDDTNAAGFLNEPGQSQVAGKLGYAFAPTAHPDKKYTGWLWSWDLAIESASKHQEEAAKFITWISSKQYVKRVAEKKGWIVVPTGTRKSTYDHPEYKKVAGFADVTLESMQNADYNNSSVKPVPYQGVQYISIPEWPQLGNEVSQEIAAAIAGKKTVDDALEAAQKIAERIAVEGGYKK